MTGKDLAKIDPGALVHAAPISKVEDLRRTLVEAAERANLVLPFAHVDNILPMHGVSIRIVTIDHTFKPGKRDPNVGSGPEVWKGSFCAPDERALGRVGIQKIAAAAGAQTLSSIRLDDGSDPFYIHMQVTRGVREFDGTYRQETKSKAVDLRNGSPLAAKMGQALGHAREVIQEVAETKASLRADRALFQLRHTYKVSELEKPFVVPKLVPALDPSDPQQKDALIAMAAGGERALFGLGQGAKAKELLDAQRVPEGAPGKGAPPPPVDAAKPVPERAAPTGVDVDDILDLMEDADEAEAEVIFVCECPCGDQTEVTPEAAKATKEKLGSVRCQPCFPSTKFDTERHKDIKDLRFPKLPGLTPESLGLKIQKAKAQK